MKNLIYTVCLLFVSLWVSAKPFTLEEQSDIVSSATIHSRLVLEFTIHGGKEANNERG